MLTVVALRAQIASVVDALSKAAVAEISKVVEDGIAALRMEMCHREDEIQKLKRSVQVLHSELGAARKPVTLCPEPRGRDGEHGFESQLLRNTINRFYRRINDNIGQDNQIFNKKS